MSEHQLFIDLALAQSADAVFEALEEFAESCGLGACHENLPMRPVGTSDNNRGAIEALESPERAFFEKVMNGHDTQIDLWLQEGRFKANPTSPTEALAEIASSDDPFTYVITSKDQTPPSGPGRQKLRSNILILDTGVGISATRFGDTILSIHGSNKITQPLFAGSYGFGGSTIHRFTDATLIYSRHRSNPTKVAFTVVFKVMKPGWLAHSYQWIHDGSGAALEADYAELPSSRLVDPADITSQNIVDFSRSRIILPQHGTGVKVFGVSGLTSATDLYETLRQIGFGIEAPVGLRHGFSNEREQTEQIRRIYNVKGLRHRLNNNPSRTASAYPVLHRQSPIPILDGQATLECWVLGESERAKDSPKPEKQSVLRRLIGDREHSPIFVTLNGQTHANLPIHVLLKNSGLPYLEGNLLIEINCDRMNRTYRSQNFTSSREHVTKQMQEDLKVDILNYLREQSDDDAPLGRLNKQFREALLAAQSDSRQDDEGTQRFARLINSSLAGAIFGTVGAASSTPRADGPIQGVGTTNPSRARKPIDLRPIPDWLEIRKATIERGAAEYVTVRTNAVNEFGDALYIELPPFLTPVGMDAGSAPILPTIGLKDGRASFYVKCEENASIGTSGEIVVRLDRSRIGLPELSDASLVTVVKREHATRQRQSTNSGSPTVPKINAHMITPEEPQWGRMEAVGIDPNEVAYTYIYDKNSGTADVFINSTFPALQHVLNEAQRKFRDPALIQRLRNDYQFALKLATLSELESKLDEIFEVETHHKAKAAAAKVLAMTCWENLGRVATGPSGKAATLVEELIRAG